MKPWVALGVDTYTIEREGMPLSSLRLYCEKWREQLGGAEQVSWGILRLHKREGSSVCAATFVELTPHRIARTQEPCTSSTAQRGQLPAHIQVHLNDSGELFKYTCARGCKLKTKRLDLAMQHNCQVRPATYARWWGRVFAAPFHTLTPLSLSHPYALPAQA